MEQSSSVNKIYLYSYYIKIICIKIKNQMYTGFILWHDIIHQILHHLNIQSHSHCSLEWNRNIKACVTFYCVIQIMSINFIISTLL